MGPDPLHNLATCRAKNGTQIFTDLEVMKPQKENSGEGK
jgi:hypothetical protein